MSISSISRNLHDAVVHQFKFEAVRSRLEVIIWESQVDKDMLWWHLIISGIRNKKDVRQTQNTIDNILARETRNSFGFRIDEFSFRKHPASEGAASYTVNLYIDHLAPLRIECTKCTLRSLDSKLFAANF